ASEKNSSRALSRPSAIAPPRPSLRELRLHFRSEILRRERLRDVPVRTERKPPLAIAIGGLSRDQEDRRRSVVLVASNELDQLEPVDVRHVDVGDHQVVRAAREEPERLESA